MQNEKKGFLGLTEKQRSRLSTGLFILIAVVLIIVNNVFTEPETEGPYPPNYNPDAPKRYSPVPDFAMVDINGDSVNTKYMEGNVTIIDFWTTWHNASRSNIEDLKALQEKYKDKNLKVIAIALDEYTKGRGTNASDVKKFAEEHNIDFPVLIGDSTIVETFGKLNTIPTMFIVNKDGIIERKVAQYIPAENIDRLIKDLF